MITLTRIFHLTYQYPTLVREITTPHLPGFVTAALNLVSTLVKLPSGSNRKPKPNTPFMEIVLHAILELIPRHPTIFRPFGTQLWSLLGDILSSSSQVYYPKQVLDIAEQLFASLYRCAPKDKSGLGWNDECKSTILSAHRAADHVFRAITEQWESVDPTLVHIKQDYSNELADPSADALGFPGWTGIHAGTDRLVTLLRILSEIISMPSAATVAIPLGPILDLTSRLTSVTIPPNGEASQNGVQFNPQISRDERELLWAELPRIHVASMDLLAHVVGVLETSTAPISQNILEQVTWVFKNEKFRRDVRSASYDLLSSVLKLTGPTMTKQSVGSVANVLRVCCHDLLPQFEDSGAAGKSQADAKSKSKGGQGTANADSFLDPELRKKQQLKAGPQFPELQQAASGLLQGALTYISPGLLAPSVRAEIDRTIILTANKDAMLASVLNPIPAAKGRGAGSSLIPFLVRGYSDEMEVEALVRPRMPVLMTAPELDAYAEMEEDEEADEMADEPFNAPSQSASFLTQPAATSVETQKTEPSAASAVPLHKRTYFEETSAELHSSPTSEKQPVQVKKARFEEKVQTPASVPAYRPTKVEASMVPKQVPATSQAPATQATSSVTAEALPVDDSDDELPALNIDPDTDDEDDDEEDDEDVAMEG
jgi:pre-rRNA-processing protein RIX1